MGEVRRSQRGGEEKKESGMRKEGKQEQLKERMIRLMEKKREGYLAEGISDMQPHHMHIHLHLVVQGRRDYRPDNGKIVP